jgi:DNA-binding NarL/FixJ family response regulator
VARVLLADDSPSTRAGIKAVLEAADFDVCAECDSAGAALDAARRERPDLCLIDVYIPGSGIRAAAEIKDNLPDTTIVMLTGSTSDQDMFDSLRAGAVGYLVKDMDPDRLPHALRGVLAGESAVPRALVARLIDQFRLQGRGRGLVLPGGRRLELTVREWEVANMLADGRSTAQMAERLFLSPVTVRRHLSGLLAKLDVEDRDEAVALIQVLR